MLLKHKWKRSWLLLWMPFFQLALLSPLFMHQRNYTTSLCSKISIKNLLSTDFWQNLKSLFIILSIYVLISLFLTSQNNNNKFIVTSMNGYNLLTSYNFKIRLFGHQKKFLNKLIILKDKSIFLDAAHKFRHLGNFF